MNALSKTSVSLVLLLGIFISSCSDNMLTRKTGQTPEAEISFTSRIPIPADGTNKPDNVAICNATELKFLNAQSMVYYDTAQQPRYNAIRVWIPKIDAAFADSRYHINFYKWKADLQGEIYFDKTPLQVRMEKKAGKQNASTYLGSLNWGKITTELAKDNVDTSDMANIFNTYSFAILLDKPQDTQSAIPYDNDPAADYDVLKIAVYKDSNLLEEKDFLLPAFYAHPVTYADGKPGVLAKLHPLYDLTNTSWPGTHFAELLNQNCF